MACPCCQPLPGVDNCCSGARRNVPRNLLVQLALTGPFPNSPPFEFRNTLCPAGSGQAMFDGSYVLPLDAVATANSSGAAFYGLSLPSGIKIGATWLCQYANTSFAERQTLQVGIYYCRWDVAGGRPRAGCYSRVGGNGVKDHTFVDPSSSQAASLGSVAPPLCDIDVGQALTVSGSTQLDSVNSRLCLYIGSTCSFSFLNDYFDCYDLSVSVSLQW